MYCDSDAALCASRLSRRRATASLTYSVALPGKEPGGRVTVKKSYAEEGETFVFTVTPDTGYELAVLNPQGSSTWATWWAVP